MILNALRLKDAAKCKSWCMVMVEVEVNDLDKTVNVRHNAARIAAEVQLDTSKVTSDNDADKATTALGAWMSEHHHGKTAVLDFEHRVVGS